jgi:formylmethanofuran dehydrogenase subunit E
MKRCNDCGEMTSSWYEHKPHSILWILCLDCLNKEVNIADLEGIEYERVS